MKDPDAMLQASREVGLEVNMQKTKYMVMSCHQNAVHNHNLTPNKSIENVAKFKYFGTTALNQNFIHEEIKSRLNLGYTCNCSVQSFVCLSPL
jgi:hypothetical protein